MACSFLSFLWPKTAPITKDNTPAIKKKTKKKIENLTKNSLLKFIRVKIIESFGINRKKAKMPKDVLS